MFPAVISGFIPQGLQTSRRRGIPWGGRGILGDREYQRLGDTKVLIILKARGSLALGDARRWRIPGAREIPKDGGLRGTLVAGSGRTE